MKKIDMSEYKKIVLDILVRVDRICRDNDIDYMIFYGTLLGAVRHKGFIPWDDDIDIVVKREDYSKLMRLVNDSEFDLRFICTATQKDTIFPFGKICDTRTVMYEQRFKPIENYGAFIDVFPLDYLPVDEQKRAAIVKKGRMVQKMIVHSARTGYMKTGSFVTNMKRKAAMTFCGMLNTYKLVKKLESEEWAQTSGKTNYLGLSWDCSFEADDLDGVSEVEFEGHKFLAPRDPDKILTSLYGDYMKLPPEAEQISNHDLECYYK